MANKEKKYSQDEFLDFVIDCYQQAEKRYTHYMKRNPDDENRKLMFNIERAIYNDMMFKLTCGKL